MHTDLTIADKSILIVEDEYEIAKRLSVEMEKRGATVIGPVPSVDDALTILARTPTLDAAILDVNLRGQLCLPVAEALEDRGIHFIFSTAYQGLIPHERYRNVPCLPKPADMDEVAHALANKKRNWLLAKLKAVDRHSLARASKPVTLRRGQLLQKQGQTIEYGYFPVDGLLSLVTRLNDGSYIEAGIIGADGLANASGLCGADVSQFAIVCKVPGTAYQVEVHALRDVFDHSTHSRAVFVKYIDDFATQLASTAISNARNSLEQRVARCLLMAYDRLPGDVIPITHEYLAMMLGVQRPGVTMACQNLERAGAIKSKRGRIKIVNHSKLRALCGDACNHIEGIIKFRSEK